MASKRNNPAPAPKPAVKKTEPVPPFERFENWLQNHKKWVIVLPLLLGTLFATLTFDVKISEGNDDAMYIEAASKYAADFTGYYYTANAPFYPMMLGVVALVTGINLILFKLINVAFFLTHLVLMYLAFRKRIPLTILAPVLLLSAINNFILYYASQTYTEMMFLTMQALFLCVFFHWYDQLISAKGTTATNSMATNVKAYLSVGFALFLMTFNKNIAIGMLGALILFFLIEKNYRAMLFSVGGYLAVRISFEAIKAMIWGASNQYGSQGAILLQKDAYNPAAGQEDLSGFVARFFENFNLYVSKRLFQILGFKDPQSIQTHGILSLLVLVLVIFAAYQIFKDRKPNGGSKQGTTSAATYLTLILLYIVTMLGLTFIVLQVKWDQPRLIMVYVPMLFMLILYGFYSYFSNTKGATGFVAYLCVVALILGSCFITTAKKSVANYPVLKKNLQGDKYYGYSPDWENYLRLSAWCADSLPPNSLVACRKAPMSFVYGKGRPFFPVYTVVAIDSTTNMGNPDSVLAYFKQNKVTHVILANLRRNPNKIDGFIINTMHRMIEPVGRKYPEKLKFVKQIGTTEPAYLYEIKYSGNGRGK